MNCEFAEKVSLLIDNELTPDETEHVKAHLADCPDCRQLEKDFLYFRKQIKEPAISVRAADSMQPAEIKLPFWKKRILLPAPAVALILLILAGLAVWAIIANRSRARDAPAIADNASGKTIERLPLQEVPSEISLSRFDKGGRAEIYTVRRESLQGSEKRRSDKE